LFSTLCAAAVDGIKKDNRHETTTSVHVERQGPMSAVRPGASTDVLHVVVVAATGSDKRGRGYVCKAQARERSPDDVIAIATPRDRQARGQIINRSSRRHEAHEGHEKTKEIFVIFVAFVTS
jgi:hypothetical protein